MARKMDGADGADGAAGLELEWNLYWPMNISSESESSECVAGGARSAHFFKMGVSSEPELTSFLCECDTRELNHDNGLEGSRLLLFQKLFQIRCPYLPARFHGSTLYLNLDRVVGVFRAGSARRR